MLFFKDGDVSENVEQQAERHESCHESRSDQTDKNMGQPGSGATTSSTNRLPRASISRTIFEALENSDKCTSRLSNMRESTQRGTPNIRESTQRGIRRPSTFGQQPDSMGEMGDGHFQVNSCRVYMYSDSFMNDIINAHTR